MKPKHIAQTAEVKAIAEEIERRIQNIDRDERLHYLPADTDTNALLALIQVNLESRINELRQLLRFIKGR